MSEATSPARGEFRSMTGESLTAVLDCAPANIFATDRQHRYTYVNESYARFLGRPAAEIIGHTHHELCPVAVADALVAAHEAIMTSGETCQSDRPIKGRVMLCTKSPYRNAAGEVIGLVGVVTDITARQRAELALRDSEEKFNAFMTALPVAAFIKDAASRNLFLNPAAQNLIGLPPDQSLGQTPAAYLDAADTASILEDDRRLQATMQPEVVEQHLKIGAELHTFMTHKFPIYRTGKPPLFGGIAFDLTEARQHEERYRSVITAMAEGMVLQGADGTILEHNEQAERILGLSRDQLLGKTSGDLDRRTLRPDGSPFPGPEHPGMVTLRTGQPGHNQVMGICTPASGLRWININTEPLFRPGETRPYAVVATFADITAQREQQAHQLRAERDLHESQRLESLGVLAGGVAHDFNNLLAGILNAVELAGSNQPPDAPAAANLRLIQRAAQRAAEICRQMLAYSGRGRFAPARLSVNALIEDSADLLRLAIGRQAALRHEFAAGLPAVEADATQLRQVLINLATNAAEAVGDGPGTVTIRTRLIRPEPGPANPASVENPPPADWVALEVADTAGGMTPEVQRMIFEPFFSTKAQGRGLGLCAVQGIVRGHAGQLEVTSAVGRGSTFRVLLPACPALPAERAAPPAPGPAARPGRRCALLVDDEEFMRLTLRSLLELEGFEVVTAADGQAAVERVAAEPRRFDVILMDLTMPRMNGDRAFTEILRHNADLKVILMSGYDAAAVVPRFAPERPQAFLMKPFLPEELRAALSLCLNADRDQQT